MGGGCGCVACQVHRHTKLQCGDEIRRRKHVEGCLVEQVEDDVECIPGRETGEIDDIHYM